MLTALAVVALAGVAVLFGDRYGIDRFLPTIMDYPPSGVLEWKDGRVDPPTFEVRVPRVCGDLKLRGVDESSDCRPVSCKAAAGARKRRIWLKPQARSFRIWCVEAKQPER